MMNCKQASIVEELIDELEGKMIMAIYDRDLERAEVIGSIIDWLKIQKNK